ncbi:hypothetical protein [Vulgatibacter sp.]|uniref:hypothetical protein n=1 Tax=Vulgatibacter sp. TaxID=1971226 RepID=UPI00356558B3
MSGAPRIDFYSNFHKGLRRLHFDFAVLAGSTDPHDAAAVEHLRVRFRQIVHVLHAHARNEATYMHPVLARHLPEAHASLELEHAGHDTELATLQAQLDRIATVAPENRQDAAMTFYRSYNRFLARQLEHLAEEESLLPHLWERCDPSELAEALGRFKEALTVEKLASDWTMMLPALNAPERHAILGMVLAKH